MFRAFLASALGLYCLLLGISGKLSGLGHKVTTSRFIAGLSSLGSGLGSSVWTCARWPRVGTAT